MLYDTVWVTINRETTLHIGNSNESREDDNSRIHTQWELSRWMHQHCADYKCESRQLNKTGHWELCDMTTSEVFYKINYFSGILWSYQHIFWLWKKIIFGVNLAIFRLKRWHWWQRTHAVVSGAPEGVSEGAFFSGLVPAHRLNISDFIFEINFGIFGIIRSCK